MELNKPRKVHPSHNIRFASSNQQNNYSGAASGGVAGMQGAPQTLKFNMGSGNNFIVKNSNIVITQGASNSDNQGAPGTFMQNAMPTGLEKRPNKRSGQSASRQGTHSQGNSGNLHTNTGGQQFSIDSKQKIYQGAGINTPGSGPAKFGLNQGFNSTKIRTQRFGVTGGNANSNQNNLGLNAATPSYNAAGGNYNHFASGPNTTNNANFQHKQRQLSYSPNMANKMANPQNTGGAKASKKRNISEAAAAHPQPSGAPNLLGQGIDPLHLNQVPSRRSQSKNDKYKDQGDISNGLNLGNMGQPSNKLGGTQVRNSQQNQRFTPMNMGASKNGGPQPVLNQQAIMQKRSGVNQSRDRSNAGINQAPSNGLFNRPQSATQKRKADGTQERNDQLNTNLRQLLQQNVQQNKENQKLIQQKIGQTSLGRNIAGGTGGKDQGKGQGSFGLQVSSTNNSRMTHQQQINRTTGAGSGNNPSVANDYLNGLIQQSNHRTEGPGMKVQGHLLQNITKRSQSQHAHQPPTGTNSKINNANANPSHVSGKKSQLKPSMNNSLFNSNDPLDPQQHMNTQQFANGAEPQGQQNAGTGPHSRGNHKRPKSNLDGLFKSSKNGPINTNELPQIDVQNRNFQRNSNKTPVVQQSHQVQSKQVPLTAEHPSMNMQPNSQSQNPQMMAHSNQKGNQQRQPQNQPQQQQPQNPQAAAAQAQPQQMINQQQKYSYYTANPRQMFTNCVTKFAFATKTGQSPSNPHKQNQDAWITVPHFCGLKYCHFFAVADGHGQYGREVSSYMKQRLPQFIEAEMRYMFQKYNEQLLKQQGNESLNTDEICIAFNNAFLNCNEELFSGILDIRFSGSTCVSIMTLGQKLFCVNVGDSRGIIVKYGAEGKIVAQAISRDQKPCQNDEATRIINCGGRIDSFRDPEKNPIGPLRVWLKTEDIPGLAMTRSFGDEVASRVGVTAEPEILELDLCKEDKFIVIASDGVWEFITNDEIAKIVKPFYDAKNAEKAAEAVVKESYLRWKREEEGIVDDITCVIVFLDVKLQQQDPSPNLLGIEQQEQNQEKEVAGATAGAAIAKVPVANPEAQPSGASEANATEASATADKNKK